MRYTLVILMLVCFSCSEKKEILPVDYFYQIQVEQMKMDKLDECKDDAIDEAEKFVDALIDKWIKEQNSNDDEFPLKPRRPSAPEKIIGKDN